MTASTATGHPTRRRALLQIAAGALGAAGAGLLTRQASAGLEPLLIDTNNPILGPGAGRTQLRSDFNGTSFRVENRNGFGDRRNAIYAHVGGYAGVDPDVPTALMGMNTVDDPEAVGVWGYGSGVGVQGWGGYGVGYTSGVGVQGYGGGPTSVGVYGLGELVGVHGTVVGSTGYGVRGIADDLGTWGVRAEGGSGGTGLSVIGSSGIPGAGGPSEGITSSGPAMQVEGSAVFDGPVQFASLSRAYIEAGSTKVRVLDPKISGPTSPIDVLVTLQSNPGAGIGVGCVVKGKGFFDVILTGKAVRKTAVGHFMAHRAARRSS